MCGQNLCETWSNHTDQMFAHYVITIIILLCLIAISVHTGYFGQDVVSLSHFEYTRCVNTRPCEADESLIEVSLLTYWLTFSTTAGRGGCALASVALGRPTYRLDSVSSGLHGHSSVRRAFQT